MKSLWLALFALCLGVQSAAAENVGAAVSAESASPALRKVGEAKLTVMFWDVYESSLYTQTGQYAPNDRPLRLDIRYLRNIRGEDLIKQTRKEWRAQGLNHPQQEAWLERLAALWPDVSENDVISLLVDEQNVAHFSLNGKPLGTVEDPAFTQQFAAIWLSPDTTRPELRAKLIGQG
jgi:hypothetical protein